MLHTKVSFIDLDCYILIYDLLFQQMLSLMDLDTGKKGKRRQILPITTPEDATEENSTATDAANHKDSPKQSPSKESKA